jgi:hypothetical protein
VVVLKNHNFPEYVGTLLQGHPPIFLSGAQFLHISSLHSNTLNGIKELEFFDKLKICLKIKLSFGLFLRFKGFFTGLKDYYGFK